jgi:hypothetical protein
MTTLLRRFLVLAALLFWQGGFLFYASVVVPIGQHAIGHRRQGSITQQVTDYLNLAGLVSLAPLAWDTAVAGDPSRLRRRLRWATWVGMALALAALAWLHVDMDLVLDEDTRTFRTLHRWYLWISTVQWGLSVAYLLLMLRAWQSETPAPPPQTTPNAPIVNG